MLLPCQGHPLAVHGEPALQQGQVEGPAVEGHQQLRPFRQLQHPGEHGPFLGVIPHQVLLHHELIPLEPAQAGQKGDGPRAAGQARGLRVEEQERIEGQILRNRHAAQVVDQPGVEHVRQMVSAPGRPIPGPVAFGGCRRGLRLLRLRPVGLQFIPEGCHLSGTGRLLLLPPRSDTAPPPDRESPSGAGAP